jgi:site-specific DNA recombinase
MKTEETPKLKYGMYGRKSSETEDRQVLSIDSQIDSAKAICKNLNIRIADEDVLTESKSAKTTNHRPLFKEMLDRLEKGKINAIVAWHADRLSRNAIDSALLVDMMDRGKLIEIVTPGQTYRNTPFDKFMFTLACTQAKMENDKKGIDVMRGLTKKATMGMFPGPAPFGYLNDKFTEKGNKKIVSDKVRLPLIRKMMELMLTGTYGPLQIREIATNEWGYRTPKGKKMGRSTIYRIFTNTFYYGMYEYPLGSGKWYRGTHETIITEEDYDKIQALLGRKGRPRPKTHIFDFVGMMKCADCGASITAETKFKKLKNGDVNTYVYYHCTKKLNPNCTQGSIEEKELKKQIVREIDKIEIPSEFHTFAMKWWKNENEKEVDDRNTIVEAQQKAYKACLAKIDGLTDMRAGGEIESDEFIRRREPLLEEKVRLEKQFEGTGRRVDAWMKTGDEMFTFIERAVQRFSHGTLEDRRSILAALGSNLLIKDKILSIDIENCLFPIQTISSSVREIKERLEPINTLEKQEQFEQICSNSPVVLPDLDSNQDTLLQRQESYH